jgi:hypothetical protein
MSFHFHEHRNPPRRRLFIPRSAFSFAAFLVPIKFRQPGSGAAAMISIASREQNFKSVSYIKQMRLLDGPVN